MCKIRKGSLYEMLYNLILPLSMESISCLQLIFITIAVLLFAFLVKFIYEICYQTMIKCLLDLKLLYQLKHDNYDVKAFLSYLLKNCNGTGIYYLDAFILKVAFVFNPEHIKLLLNDYENIDRPLIMRGMKGVADESLLMRNGEKWKDSKRLFNPIFHINNLEKFIPKLEYFSRNFVKSINKEQSSNNVNIEFLLKQFIFTMTFHTILGIRNSATGNKLAESIKLVDKIIEIGTGVFMKRIFNIFLWNEFTFFLTSSGRKFKNCVLFDTELITKIILDYSEKMKKNEALECNSEFQVITIAAILHRCLINNKISLKTFIDESLILTVAGHHTTSMTLCWCLYELGKNKIIQSRVQEEIDSVFYNDFQRPISKEDLNKLIYLECVIKETMRLYPVISNTARKSTQDLKFGGIKYSKGTSFVIPIFHLHRNPIYFPNPNVFDPDRFLSENSSNINSYAYIPFSAGIRMCIGHNYAMIVMKIFLTVFLRQYTMDTVEDVTPKMTGLFLAADGSFVLKIKNRF